MRPFWGSERGLIVPVVGAAPWALPLRPPLPDHAATEDDLAAPGSFERPRRGVAVDDGHHDRVAGGAAFELRSFTPVLAHRPMVSGATDTSEPTSGTSSRMSAGSRLPTRVATLRMSRDLWGALSTHESRDAVGRFLL